METWRKIWKLPKNIENLFNKYVNMEKKNMFTLKEVFTIWI